MTSEITPRRGFVEHASRHCHANLENLSLGVDAGLYTFWPHWVLM
ncbi:hypothetical protein N9J86_03460 [Gammaproteobacteria bacterium]|nr:hypothetical protein [Gammaproteobacteria bacterium]